MPIGLYIHIPFCARKCAYCDFASYANRMGELPGYLCALENEMEQWAGREAATVFIGGGTPSLMSGEQIETLMRAVRKHFVLPEGAEITLEANPGTLDLGKLRACLAAGVNRLSMGVQAMQPALLRTLGRIHTWQDAALGVELARRAGFSNINLDLMYALPGQTLSDWEHTLRAAIGLGVPHVSAYSLILEEGTPLYRRADLAYPEEELALEMQRAATRMLGGAGLIRYEVSNYAKPGFACRHNIAYWTRRDYLGLGAAAHSLMDGVRFENSPEVAGYRRLQPHALTEREIFEERVMLGTRMTSGIPLDGLDAGKVEKLARLGLAKTDQGLLSLTEKGLELHNAVVLELI